MVEAVESKWIAATDAVKGAMNRVGLLFVSGTRGRQNNKSCSIKKKA